MAWRCPVADRIAPPPSPQHALHLIEILLRTYVPKNTPDWQAWQAAVAILKAPSGVAIPLNEQPKD